MKILVNGNDAICNYCGHRGAEAIAGIVVCPFCGSEELKNKHWNQFVPKWKKDTRNLSRGNWSHHMRRKGDPNERML